MKDPFFAVARRQNRQIDMAVGKINRLSVFAGFTAARDLVETERGLLKLRELLGVLRQ